MNYMFKKKNSNCDNYKYKQKENYNFGSSNKLMYDCCEYEKSLEQSVTPLSYYLYDGKYENGHKCVYDKQFWKPQDLVDIESELFNLTRPATKCPSGHYNPNCQASPHCFSTFDKNVPVVINPDVCPIVHNNIKKATNPGYTLINTNLYRRY